MISLDLNGVCGGALDFKSEGRWFETQSLQSCCFLRQEILLHFVSLHSGVASNSCSHEITGVVLIHINYIRGDEKVHVERCELLMRSEQRVNIGQRMYKLFNQGC